MIRSREDTETKYTFLRLAETFDANLSPVMVEALHSISTSTRKLSNYPKYYTTNHSWTGPHRFRNCLSCQKLLRGSDFDENLL